MTASVAACWVITDSAAGNQRQALALAGRMDMPMRHLVLQPRAPWSWLAPRLTMGGRLALPSAQRALFAAPWPSLAIGCGRAAALFTRMLRPLSEGRCHTVQILDPRLDPAHWDTVIAPRHDGLAGPNVLAPLGSLHPVDDAWLADAREAFPLLGKLPGPRIGVLLGGPRHGIALDGSYADRLAAHLRMRLERDGGSLLLVASRRTPDALVEAVRRSLPDAPRLIWRGPRDGANPYPGVLAWADRLVVTPDSVNMLSEACGVGCPVEAVVAAPLPERIARFHESLRAAGYLAGDSAGAPPLRETAGIAATLRQRVAQASGAP